MVEIKVIDRKGQEVCGKQEASSDMTVDDLRKLILKKSPELSK